MSGPGPLAGRFDLLQHDPKGTVRLVHVARGLTGQPRLNPDGTQMLVTQEAWDACRGLRPKP